MVQLRAGTSLLEEDVALKPPRQHLGELVFGVSAVRNTKDVVELFKGLLLRLRDKEKDEGEGNQVEAGVEAESSGGGHGGQHSRESQRKDGGPEVVGGNGPRHANLTMGQREDFRRVHEGDGTLAC